MCHKTFERVNVGKDYFLLFFNMLGLKISVSPHEKVRRSGFLLFFPECYAKRFQNLDTSGYNAVLLLPPGLLAVDLP
jgi:hypothetical protein